ncbi:hypothetical protein IWX49DRAFT_252602 [Phyllosticta citricarpa]|uniref:Uncharacterized protein n=1 Tax=Phyllosticta citricarpa TaxID=55181 RepID=A0ABR1LPM0_9PEZI
MASALFKPPRRPALRQLVGKTPAFRQWLSKQAGPKKKWEDQFRSQLERSALFDDLIVKIRAGKYRLQGRWNFDNAPHHQHLRTVQNYMLPYLKQMSECAQEAPWDVCSAAQAAVIRLLEKEQGIVYPHQLHNIIKAMKDVSNASARAQQQENLASESSLQQHAEDHTAAESSAADSARPKSRGKRLLHANLSAGKLSDGNQGLTYVRPTWVTKPQPSLSSSSKATTPERSNDQASAADTTTSESTTPKSTVDPTTQTEFLSEAPKPVADIDAPASVPQQSSLDQAAQTEPLSEAPKPTADIDASTSVLQQSSVDQAAAQTEPLSEAPKPAADADAFASISQESSVDQDAQTKPPSEAPKPAADVDDSTSVLQQSSVDQVAAQTEPLSEVPEPAADVNASASVPQESSVDQAAQTEPISEAHKPVALPALTDLAKEDYGPLFKKRL